jgi:hypothetical protein
VDVNLDKKPLVKRRKDNKLKEEKSVSCPTNKLIKFLKEK